MKRTALKDFWKFIHSMSDDVYGDAIGFLDYMRNITEEEVDEIIKQGVESGEYTDEIETNMRTTLNNLM